MLTLFFTGRESGLSCSSLRTSVEVLIGVLIGVLWDGHVSRDVIGTFDPAAARCCPPKTLSNFWNFRFRASLGGLWSTINLFLARLAVFSLEGNLGIGAMDNGKVRSKNESNYSVPLTEQETMCWQKWRLSVMRLNYALYSTSVTISTVRLTL